MKKGIALIILFSSIFISCSDSGQKVIRVEDGVMDFSGYDFKRDGISRIEGEAHYYPSQLLSYAQLNSGDYTYLTVRFPGKLSDQLPENTAIGYGTYHFRIKVPHDENVYGLNIEGIFSAYKVFLNDRLEDQMGVVGTNKHAEVPMVRPEILGLHMDEGYNDLLIQVSNYYEPQTQISFKMEFGEMDSLYQKQQVSYGYDFSFSFLYFLLFLIFIYLFIMHRQVEYILFSLYCLCLSYRFLIKNSKVLLEVVDSSWTFFYKSEFVTYYVTSALVPILLCIIYGIKNMKTLKMTIVGIMAFASIFTFFTPISFSSRFTFLYHYYSIVLVLLCIIGTIVLYLLKPGRKYYELVLGVAIYSWCFLYDLIMSLLFYKESFYYNWGLAILSITIAITLIRMKFFKKKEYKLQE